MLSIANQTYFEINYFIFRHIAIVYLWLLIIPLIDTFSLLACCDFLGSRQSITRVHWRIC